jgi:hypothetical protein
MPISLLPGTVKELEVSIDETFAGVKDDADYVETDNRFNAGFVFALLLKVYVWKI